MNNKENSNGFSVDESEFIGNGDIVNPETPSDEATVSLSDFGGNASFKRKKRGIVGWWQRRRVWQRTLIIIFLVLSVLLSGAAGVFFTLFDYNYNSITKNPEDLGFENVLNENIVNVALFGLDTRSLKSFEGNSDSIMILSLNTETKKVKVISVMRDSFVPITYNGKKRYGKINSAYAWGGPELAIKTLNTVFGLDISEYATVNFFGMADIIDAVGGIEAELTEAEVTSNTNVKALNFCIKELCGKLKLNAEDYYIYNSGVQKLNGVQAVAYSRIRYVANIWGTNNDFGRTDRQRYVMEQLFNKALTMEKSQYVKLVKSLLPCTETSLSYKEIMGLAFDMLLKSPTFEQSRMPQQEYMMSSPSGYGSVVYYDLDFAKKLIHAFIYEDLSFERYIEVNGIEKYDWYANRFSTGTSSGGSAGQASPGYTQADPNATQSNASSYIGGTYSDIGIIGNGNTASDVIEGNSSGTQSDVTVTEPSSGSASDSSDTSSDSSQNPSSDSVSADSSESSGNDSTVEENSSAESTDSGDNTGSIPTLS